MAPGSRDTSAGGGPRDLRELQQREEGVLLVLDSVETVLQKQAHLGQALSKGCMGLASVRYSSGPHALDHFIGCALSGKKVADVTQMRLFFDAASQQWRVGAAGEGVVKGAQVPRGQGEGAEGKGADPNESEGKKAEANTRAKLNGFYGPPALRQSATDFQGALTLVAEILNARSTLIGAAMPQD